MLTTPANGGSKVAVGLAVALACAPACVEQPAGEPALGSTEAPLIGGVESGPDDDLAVVHFATNFGSCTGTLVSPSVVLTAAHCVQGVSDSGTVHFGNDVNSGGYKVGIVDSHFNFEFDIDRLSAGRDVGMLRLQFPQDPELPMPLNRRAPVQGEPYRIIGFGIYDADTRANDSKKRSGVTTVGSLANGDQIILTNPSVTICQGDSGGPGFVDVAGVEHVAGIHSWTSGECFGQGGDIRVDLYADDFIQPWIQQNDPACRADGLCARLGCVDDPDCEPCGPEGTCTEGCAIPDPDCPTADIGELCQADSQCMSGTCVWWRDDPVTTFCTRSCDPGNDDCAGGMSCQSRPSVGNVCYYDQAPPGVLGSECTSMLECGSQLCIDEVCVNECDLSVGLTCPPNFECASRDQQSYYCFATGGGGGGGCNTGGRESAPSALWLLAAAWLIARRRDTNDRRRRR